MVKEFVAGATELTERLNKIDASPCTYTHIVFFFFITFVREGRRKERKRRTRYEGGAVADSILEEGDTWSIVRSCGVAHKKRKINQQHQEEEDWVVRPQLSQY